MFDLDKLVRVNVKSLVPYSSARDDYNGREGTFLDANENPYGNLNRYPDPYHKELKAALSLVKGIPEENIFLGNGSDEIIDLCYRIFCNPGKDKAMIFPPTYGMYEVSASINDVSLIRVPLDSSFQLDPERIRAKLDDKNLKLIFICSPNNPTGNAMKINDIESVISMFPAIVVVDEAYIDFSRFPSLKTRIDKYPNLIVMQTISKAMGMASVRIGMAFCSREIVSLFNKMKPPYNISTINQRAALKRLRHSKLLTNQLRMIKTERERLRRNLEKIPIIEEIFPSDANFLLVRTKDPDFIYSSLVNERIIVRNRSKSVPGSIRITVGKKSENNRLIKALKKISL